MTYSRLLCRIFPASTRCSLFQFTDRNVDKPLLKTNDLSAELYFYLVYWWWKGVEDRARHGFYVPLVLILSSPGACSGRAERTRYGEVPRET